MAKFKKKKEEKVEEIPVSTAQPLINALAAKLRTVSFVASCPENIRSRTTGWVNTGSTLLNCAICDGDPTKGYPLPRIVHVYGPAGEGKTALAMELAKSVQEIGGIVMWIETAGESSFDLEWAKKIGVRPDNFIPTYAGSLEQLEKMVDAAVEVDKAFFAQNKEHQVIVIIVDSLEGLKSKDEPTGLGMTDTPRKWSEMVKNGLLGRIAETKIGLFLISQVRLIDFQQGSYQKPKGDASQGNALRHAAWVKIEVTSFPLRISISDGKGEVSKLAIGQYCHCNIVKNKAGSPFRIAAFPLYYDKGIDDVESCIEYLLETNKRPNIIMNSKSGMVILNKTDSDSGESKKKKTFFKEVKENKDMITYYKRLAVEVWNELNVVGNLKSGKYKAPKEEGTTNEEDSTEE
jgi:RecA/RadA recombinase